MFKSTGHADLPLHGGTVPKWLADRMMQMGTLIVESLIENFGKKEVLVRLSDPLWFQSLGAVMGMDWHSSGITTSVMYALKRGINARAREFGLCVCGGRGKYSRRTPDELRFLADATGLDGDNLVNSSKLVAKVDSTAVQDGFQLYMHNFILSNEGDWTVVQQGMNVETKTARRYHWSSENLRSFIEEPHSGVTGENEGLILNLTAKEAEKTRGRILDFSKINPDKAIKEIQNVIKHDDNKILVPQKIITAYNENKSLAEQRSIVMPAHHEVRAEDVNLKRLGAVLATAYEATPKDFESLLLTPGLGPRTLQSLTLVSEVIYGTPSRFTDPARFSFAHGGKDGHPFPVPLKVYDESIRILHESIERSRMGYKDKSDAIKRLHSTALEIEKYCDPVADFDKTVDREWNMSPGLDGRMEGKIIR
ncbi:MAG: DUF763 domain-containing protein [Treponema sp.]|nr:DUF763 domain-containing protein [Candidatus Treponema merdequi]